MIKEIKQFISNELPFVVRLDVARRHRLSQRKIRRILNEKREIAVEVGAGDRVGRGNWVTIDVTRGCDIYWDLRRGIPFPNESVQAIYSSHFFEHLSFKQINAFLDECKRVLVSHGKFLICVPNARIYLEAYVNGSSLNPETFFGYKPAYDHTTRIDYVNYTAYMDGEHKYMFDEENLLFILRSKGFRNVRLREFDPDLDLKDRDFESIYAEAER